MAEYFISGLFQHAGVNQRLLRCILAASGMVTSIYIHAVDVFEPQAETGSEHFACQDTVAEKERSSINMKLIKTALNKKRKLTSGFRPRLN